jgi:cytochrome P450
VFLLKSRVVVAMVSQQSSVDYDAVDLDKVDFFSSEVLADPYELLARLRRERPVAKFRQAGFGRDQYVVTTHALVEEVFRDHNRFSSNYMEILTGGGKGDPQASAILATTWPEVNTLLTADEPDHTRLRSLAAKGFMPKRINRMAELIGQVISTLIDNFIERGECDFVREFAVPMPINSIGAVLGIPSSYYAKLYDWTFSLMRRNGQMGTPAEQVEDARQIVELKEFVASLVHDRQKNPKDDLLSDLVTARVDGQSPFSEHETLSTALMLLVGGAETTRSTLISAMARLMQTPGQLQLLHNDIALAPKAVEETLRLDTPGTAIWRIANVDTELGGVKIPKGAIIMMRMDSANRDETVFENSEVFNILRTDVNRHLALGTGIHYCIGFRLAREQASQSVAALLTRLKDVHMVPEKSDLRAHPSVHTRCLRELHLAFVPGQRALHRAA